VEGTPGAPVLFGDVTVTCITCHDPHKEVPGQTKNTRRPVMMTDYSTTFITIQGNVFLDRQPVQLDGQAMPQFASSASGEESGLTLYATRLAPGTTITGNFFNPHYLGTGAMLWGANAYEYAGKLYSVNADIRVQTVLPAIWVVQHLTTRTAPYLGAERGNMQYC